KAARAGPARPSRTRRRPRAAAMKKYLPAAALLLCGTGLLAASPSPPPDGAALVARYRQLAGCRMRMEIALRPDAVPAQRATATLLFRRPGNLRVDWDGFQQSVQFVRTPREHRAFYPQQQSYGELT